jgi:hypothetical protein
MHIEVSSRLRNAHAAHRHKLHRFVLKFPAENSSRGSAPWGGVNCSPAG